MKQHHHRWLARFVVSGLMILLAFIGLIVASLRQDGAWQYWRIMVPIFTVLSLWLSWYLRKKKHSFTAVKIWHEILHWLSLIVSVYFVSLFVDLGIMGRVQASLQVIILLALTTFIAGIYIEITFMPIGVLLGLFTLAAAWAEEYLYTILLPITLIVVVGLFYMAHKLKHKEPDN